MALPSSEKRRRSGLRTRPNGQYAGQTEPRTPSSFKVKRDENLNIEAKILEIFLFEVFEGDVESAEKGCMEME